MTGQCDDDSRLTSSRMAQHAARKKPATQQISRRLTGMQIFRQQTHQQQQQQADQHQQLQRRSKAHVDETTTATTTRQQHSSPRQKCSMAQPALSPQQQPPSSQSRATGRQITQMTGLSGLRGQVEPTVRRRRSGADQVQRASISLAPGTASSPESVRMSTRSYTMVCKTMGCEALVDRGRARIAAYRRGRLGLGPYEKGGEEDYQPGDGCGSWHCSRHYAASRFAYYQNAMAAQLRRGAGGRRRRR